MIWKLGKGEGSMVCCCLGGLELHVFFGHVHVTNHSRSEGCCFFSVFRDIGRLLDDCLCHIGGFKDGFHGYVSFQPADKKTCLVWTRRTLGI